MHQLSIHGLKKTEEAMSQQGHGMKLANTHTCVDSSLQ